VLVLSDARALPFCPGSFDAVFACHLLSHLSGGDRRICARELSRVLAAGGRLFFCDFSRGDFRYGTGTPTEPDTFVRGNGIRTHYFTPGEAEDLFSGLEPAGLSVRSWTLRIRGVEHCRSEIWGEFVRRDG
jgi:SAM-dependent methyltransferase